MTSDDRGDRAPDPRPARTRAAVYEAARSLNAEGAEVTVNSLTRRAGISRAAFYSHFSGLDDLVGAMIGALVADIREGTRALAAEGSSMHRVVQFSATSTARDVVRHRTFLRGTLHWKFSHRPYLVLVERCADLFEFAFDVLGEEVPGWLPRRETATYMAGGFLQVLIGWLSSPPEGLDRQDAPEGSADGPADAPADGPVGGPAGGSVAGMTADELAAAQELAETLLRVMPEWYTGIAPGEPIPEHILRIESPPSGSPDPDPSDTGPGHRARGEGLDGA